jgi:aspartate-semialdehyde dehydrogenase
MVEALPRVAVVGATGSLGSELIDVLEERRFPVGELHPIATDRSLGREVEFAGEIYAVETGVASFEGLDLVFLCAPAAASLDYAGMALRGRVPCIDLSGALVAQPDVGLLVADWLGPEMELDQPLVAGPSGPALALALVLRPLQEVAGLRRVVGTTLEAASVRGRGGIDALSGQSIALFNQQELPESEDGDGPVAFDCLPTIGPPGGAGETDHEARLAAALERLLGRPLPLAVTAVRVPTFSGDGISLRVETERSLSPEEACAALEKASGVEVWPDASGPSTRTAVGRDAALVGRVREAAGGIQLWIAADGLRLAAGNGVKLAEARPFRG